MPWSLVHKETISPCLLPLITLPVPAFFLMVSGVIFHKYPCHYVTTVLQRHIWDTREMAQKLRHGLLWQKTRVCFPVLTQ